MHHSLKHDVTSFRGSDVAPEIGHAATPVARHDSLASQERAYMYLT